MRIGFWRGVMLAVALFSIAATAPKASADGFHHTIPQEVLAYDYNTGGPYMAPPIPWGHYAKDGLFDHFYHKGCILCGLCHGKGCGKCGGRGCDGNHSGGGTGGGLGGKCGHGLFNHCGNGGSGLGGKCGHGLFNHCGSGSGSSACGDPGCGMGGGHGHGKRVKDCGLCKNKGCGFCNATGSGAPIYALASGEAPAVVPVTSPQVTPLVPSSQCSDPGCGFGGGHKGGHGSLCGGCKGKGCGKCGGLGLFHHGNGVGGGDPCNACGGKGCGKCGGLGFGKGCGACGGKGCGKCGGGLGLGGQMKGKLAGLLHHGKGNIQYFVGPGGPVPLTPGYVPYINPVRSPRDFLAFPPYTPNDP